MEKIWWKPTTVFLKLPDRGGGRFFSGYMLHCVGNLLAFLRLQGLQAATTLSQRDRPPFERGVTWSKVKSLAGNFLSQYWQVNLSRKNTLKRVNAGVRLCGIYSFKAITDGKGHCQGRRTYHLFIFSYYSHPIQKHSFYAILP